MSVKKRLLFRSRLYTGYRSMVFHHKRHLGGWLQMCPSASPFLSGPLPGRWSMTDLLQRQHAAVCQCHIASSVGQSCRQVAASRLLHEVCNSIIITPPACQRAGELITTKPCNGISLSSALWHARPVLTNGWLVAANHRIIDNVQSNVSLPTDEDPDR